MFPFVKISSVTLLNYEEVEVFQKIVILSFLFLLLRSPPTKPFSRRCLWEATPTEPSLWFAMFVCLFFSQNPGVSVFSSLSVPSRFWLGKERMNCGSVGTDGEKGEKMTASTRCLAFPKSADTQSLSSLLLFPSEYLVCGRNPCSLY